MRLDPVRPAAFDVVCAGEALWDFTSALGSGVPSPRFRAGGGAVNAAVALARGGLRVGLAAVVADDGLRERAGRAAGGGGGST